MFLRAASPPNGACRERVRRAGLAAEQSASLIGRTSELSRISAALQAVAGGQGRVLFVSGQPGIGKTTLAREALTMARSRGFVALEGRAHALEGGLGYAPLVDALGSFLRSLDPAERGRLVSGLPDLGRLLDGLQLPPPIPLGDPALEKTRVFEAVTRLVERVSSKQPIALFLDDLHWADPASVELLHYLSRGLADLPVLLLSTYRLQEAPSARGLELLLKSLRRMGLLEELTLQPLDADGVAELAGRLLGHAVSPRLLELLDARAAGVPLFVQALVRGLMEAGYLVRNEAGWELGLVPPGIIPRDVRDLVTEQLDQIAPVERRLVELIAAGGDLAPHPVLWEVSGLGEDELSGALLRLRALGLITEEHLDADVAYGLAHPLIQDVAYHDLQEIVRRRIHAAYVRALERVGPGDLSRLARHYHGAATEVDDGRALQVLMEAGERARGSHANDDASRHFRAALEIARRTGRTDLLPVLLERLGEAWMLVGEQAAAVEAWKEALTVHLEAGNLSAVGRLRRYLVQAEWDRGNLESAQEHAEAGLAELSGSGALQELADLLYTHGWHLNRAGDLARLEDMAPRLRQLADQLKTPCVRAQAYLTEAGLEAQKANMVVAHQKTREAHSAAQECGDPLLQQRVSGTLTLFLLSLGEVRSARQSALECLRLAQGLGAPALELWPHILLAFSDFFLGAWDRALAETQRGIEVASRLDHPRYGVLISVERALLLTYLGDLEEAEMLLAEAREGYGSRFRRDRHIFTLFCMVEVAVALEKGDAKRASRAADGLAVPGLIYVPSGLAVKAEALIAGGDLGGALLVIALLRSTGGREGLLSAALADRLEGTVRHQRGEKEAGVSLLAAAAQRFDGLGVPFEAARARLQWADLTAESDRPAAVAAARRSLSAFEELGARLYAGRARRLLRRLGVRTPGPRPGQPEDALLSAREMEVARLVAEGLSNAEIAERLIVSPRTVGTHLEHIYVRLGINSRAALARYVVEVDLVRSRDRDT
jgi:DNA-binding CsgD family transcriptional regulator/tetratricopeptide (TPR) repeat protein